MYNNDDLLAQWPVSLGAYTTWNSVKPGIFSGTSPRDGVFVFSNGLLLGSDSSSVNFVIPGLAELWHYVRGDELVYLVITESSSDEDLANAWSNQNIREEDLHRRSSEDMVMLDLSDVTVTQH